MKSTRLWSFIIFSAVFTAVALTFAYSGPEESIAQTGAATPPEPTRDELYAGVWNKGQAISWDLAEIDFFSPHPQGFRPEQPIKFSHRRHIEKAKMECQYCHSGINKSHFATIPSVESCMGCHTSVLPDSPEIKKLKAHFDKKEPIQWEPVNNLPEHVRFNHERHLKAGVGCQSCHGQIQKMEVVEKAASLKMGFCVSCHRDKGATIDCAACHY